MHILDGIRLVYPRNTITCLFDYDKLPIAISSKACRLIETEVEFASPDTKLYALHIWETDKDVTYGLFLEMKESKFRFCIGYVKNGLVTPPGFCKWMDYDAPYRYSKEEFCEFAIGWTFDPVLDAQIHDMVWVTIMQLFPDYEENKKLRETLFEASYAYDLDWLVGAERYEGKGIRYKLLAGQDEENMREVQIWEVCDWEEPNETAKLLKVNWMRPVPDTKEKFDEWTEGWFQKERRNAIDSIPHRVIHIPPEKHECEDYMYFEADYRSLHIYKTKTAMCLIVLKTYSVYNGHPRSGGRMEGETFSKTLKVPAEQYTWSDYELVASYLPYFPK